MSKLFFNTVISLNFFYRKYETENNLVILKTNFLKIICKIISL